MSKMIVECDRATVDLSHLSHVTGCDRATVDLSHEGTV